MSAVNINFLFKSTWKVRRWTYFSCWSQEMMRFMSSLMVFSISSSMDWSRGNKSGFYVHRAQFSINLHHPSHIISYTVTFFDCNIKPNSFINKIAFVLWHTSWHQKSYHTKKLTFTMTYLIHITWVETCQSAGQQKCASTLNDHTVRVLE